MNKPLLLSLAAAAILTTNLNAQSMYERIQSMELKMKKMQQQLTVLKESEKGNDEKDDMEDVAVTYKEVLNKSDNDEDEDEGDDDEETVEEQIADMQESLTDLNKATNGNHIKFSVDYRFAIENLQYKMADGSEANNDAFMTNRLWLNMNYKANDNLSFTGQLAYNKAFGQRADGKAAEYNLENFDWITSENAYDDVLRVRSAYFFYKNDEFLGAKIPWTFSIGRRPSTNGHLVNLRDDDNAASPLGHSINVEFDGLSSKFAFEDLIGVEGMYIKFCFGRGLSNAGGKFTPTSYATVETTNPDIDLAGLIFTPYDDGQYSINTQYYYANNLIDAIDPSNQAAGFNTVGGLHSLTAGFTANGIGDELSDYLDETLFFLSGSMSITNPDKEYTHQNPLTGDRYLAKGMLGSSKAETGYSVWAGVQTPSLLTEDGRWGLEYNHGTKYWRSITYAEDTNIGSKLAARGDSYEAYFTEPLMDDVFSLQIRYTYTDYAYAGSNGFFGDTTGTALSIDEAVAYGFGNSVVDTAQDIRFYLRYRY